MKKAIIWSKTNCPFCDQAKSLLKSKGIQFEERKLDDGWTVDELRQAIPGVGSLPQIVIDDVVIGGFKKLVEYFEKEKHVN